MIKGALFLVSGTRVKGRGLWDAKEVPLSTMSVRDSIESQEYALLQHMEVTLWIATVE